MPPYQQAQGISAVHGSILTTTDVIVLVIGFLCAAYTWIRSERDRDGRTLLLGFGAGTATAYLVGLVVTMLGFPKIYNEMLHSNLVLVCGSFAYAAVMNVMTLPPLPPWPWLKRRTSS
ncbi:MAG TPA: hypothetical protein VII56_15975 [Rhizomicrobium sp.]